PTSGEQGTIMEQPTSAQPNSGATNSSSQSFMGDFAEASHELLMADSAVARAEAARRLASLAKPLAGPYLIAALSDRSWEGRQAAVDGLGEIGEVDAIEPLQELLSRGNQDVLLQQSIAKAIESISARSLSSVPAQTISAPAVHVLASSDPFEEETELTFEPKSEVAE